MSACRRPLEYISSGPGNTWSASVTSTVTSITSTTFITDIDNLVDIALVVTMLAMTLLVLALAATVHAAATAVHVLVGIELILDLSRFRLPPLRLLLRLRHVVQDLLWHVRLADSTMVLSASTTSMIAVTGARRGNPIRPLMFQPSRLETRA